MKRLLFLAATCFFVLWAALMPVGSQEKRRRLPYRFLIPEGYVGWVRVDFGVAGAPPLPAEDGYYVLKIPLTGRLKTSSSDMIVRGEQYYYFSDDTKYRLKIDSQSPACMIQEHFMGPAPAYNAPNRYRYVFVGTIAEYEEYKSKDSVRREQKEDGYPKVGPLVFLTKEELERLNIRRP